MKKLFALICLLSCLLCILTAKTDHDFSDNTVMVVLKPEISEPTKSLPDSFFIDILNVGAQFIASEIKVENISLIPNEKALEALKARGSQYKAIYKITLPTHDKANVLKTIEILNKIEGIEYAAPDYIVKADLVPNDPAYNQLWGLHGTHGIKAPEAWEITTGYQGIRVGVIDTGVANHPDLVANTVTGYDFYNNNATTSDDIGGHGTHVSGTIGAVGDNGLGIVGVNWMVSIVPLQSSFINENGEERFYLSTIASAISYATVSWMINEKISVLNHSISGYGAYSDDVRLAAINNYPGLFVWAAGNGDEDQIGDDVDTYTPYISYYDLSNLIAVGAIRSDGQKTNFSNYSTSGNYVHVFAPGEGIYSTIPNNGYASWGGTSMAAPHATGVAALLLSANTALTAPVLKQLLIYSADPLVINTPHGVQTVNRLNVQRAMEMGLGNGFLIISPTSHDFGSLDVNATSESQTFTISLIGDGSFLIDTITLTGTYAEDFTLDTADLPLTISSDDPQTFTVSFTPTSGGRKTASVNITSNVNDVLYTVDLTGIGLITSTGIPYAENFDEAMGLGDISWGGDVNDASGIIAFSGVDHTNGLALNLYNAHPTQNVFTPTINGVDTHTALTFAYRIVNWTNNWNGNLTATTLSANEKVFIEVSTTGSNGTYTVLQEINSTNHSPSTAFTVLGLPLSAYNAQDVNIRFRAVWTTGSWYLVLDNVLVYDNTVILPPQNFIATAGNNFADLAWQAPANAYPLRYNVFRNGEVIFFTSSALSFRDNTAQNGNQYIYKASATYVGGSESDTDPMTVILYDIRPPSSLQATFSDEGTIALVWNPPTSVEGFLHYIVYRRLSGGSPDFVPISEPIAETYTDSDLVYETTHFYRVTAVYPNGESAYSNIVSARPTGDSDGVVLPVVTALTGNYPNPFNPETVISFSLAREGKVSIDIYNMRGQKVRSLLEGVYGAGVHSAVWNGCDGLGRSVGSGVYFYRMSAGEFVSVRKMVLLK